MSSARLDPSLLDGAEATLERLVALGVLHGAVLGVSNAAGTTWFATVGSVSVGGREEPPSTDHRFLLTSVTKPLTATQTLLLAQDGLLDLDAPVAAYVPEFAAGGKRNVTTRHLLTHTGGLSDMANLVEGPAVERGPDDYIAAAVRASLAFEPGGGWSYCSPGFWVMAELVNRLRGVSYWDDLHEQVCAPLGLEHTGYVRADTPPERYVDTRVDEPYAHLPEQVRRAAYPAGGVISTVPDLVRFGRAFLAGSDESDLLLSAPARAQLWERHAKGWNKGRPVGWSLGWEQPGPGNLQSRRTIFHHGASGTALWVDPEHGITVALLTADWWLSDQRYAEVLNSVMRAVR